MSDLNIHQRILAVTKELDERRKEIKTDKDIKSGEKILYSVISRDAVIKIVTPLMVKHGINAMPSACEHERTGNMTIVKTAMRYFNTDKPDDFIETISYGYGIDSQDKGIGKAQTYAERYNYQKTYKINTGDDIEDDSIDFKEDPISELQLIELNEICEGYNWKPADVLKRMADKVYGLKKIDDLPAKNFDDAKVRLKTRWEDEVKELKDNE